MPRQQSNCAWVSVGIKVTLFLVGAGLLCWMGMLLAQSQAVAGTCLRQNITQTKGKDGSCGTDGDSSGWIAQIRNVHFFPNSGGGNHTCEYVQSFTFSTDCVIFASSALARNASWCWSVPVAPGGPLQRIWQKLTGESVQYQCSREKGGAADLSSAIVMFAGGIGAFLSAVVTLYQARRRRVGYHQLAATDRQPYVVHYDDADSCHSVHTAESSIDGVYGAETGASWCECVICLDEMKEVVFLPCKHMCACVGCAKRLSKCPVCREPVVDRLKVRVAPAAARSPPQPSSVLGDSGPLGTSRSQRQSPVLAAAAVAPEPESPKE
eukprot:TRINITY_DN9998_c1_g1_i1.p1 TRINITY_DN9998_c1_g1~~TRINITY_DN9998_c1_g1_i1.p1  ORF type:complete len:323 (+),score=83.99 TRINITY_DN9998_c1_g1_i1:160-1128(+)